MRVLLAYSGGLDTSYLVAWLTREARHDVVTLAVDCGGWTDDERRALAERAATLGASRHLCVDAREELFDRVLRWLLAANVRRGDVYPLCVGAERGLQAEILARVAEEGGFDAVAHGCTAAGNDQIRFEAALSTVAPDPPCRPDPRPALSRDPGARVPQRRACPSAGRRSPFCELRSLGTPIGAVPAHERHLPDDAWWDPGRPRRARVRRGLRSGIPPARRRGGPVDLIERLNREAGELGVGRGYHLGDTVLGFKGRIAFEAPAAEILLAAHRELEKLVLTEEQRFWKDHLGDVYGRRLHQGLFHDPFQRDLEAFFASSQARVSGTAHVRCAEGALLVEGVSSPFSPLPRPTRATASAPPAPTPRGIAPRAMAEPARLYRRAGEATCGGRPMKRAVSTRSPRSRCGWGSTRTRSSARTFPPWPAPFSLAAC